MAKKSRTYDLLNPIEQSQIKRAEKQEDTRSRIANMFIVGYLVVLLVLIFLTTFYDLEVETVKDFLLTIGSPLGFIIGFYFKSAEQ